MEQVGMILGIPLTDHVIVGRGMEYYSFREKEILKMMKKLLAAAVWFFGTYLLVAGRAIPRRSEVFDLRGAAVSPQRIDAFTEKYPGKTILWDVPLSGGKQASDAGSIDIFSLSLDDVALFSYFTDLKTVNAPSCTDYAALAALRRAGVNRLSVGIQSFDDACLKLMNRRHNAAQAVEAVRSAQREGYENITVDLIFGVPGFGDDTLRRSLDSALALGVQHISAYHLTVEPGTAFGRRAARGQFAPVDEATSETEYALVHETLTGAGFEHYEVSNFALPGFRARHNAAYWHGVKYLGIGPAAHSFDGRERHWNVASVTEYIGGAPAEAETLTDRDRFNEYVMTRLRTADGLRTGDLAVRFGARKLQYFLRQAQKFTAAGTLQVESGRYYIPPTHWFISDSVISDLFLA